MKSSRVKWIVLLSLIASPAVATTEEAHELPDGEFLEFLATWDDGEGSWFDPMILLDPQSDVSEVQADE